MLVRVLFLSYKVPHQKITFSYAEIIKVLFNLSSLLFPLSTHQVYLNSLV